MLSVKRSNTLSMLLVKQSNLYYILVKIAFIKIFYCSVILFFFDMHNGKKVRSKSQNKPLAWRKKQNARRRRLTCCTFKFYFWSWSNLASFGQIQKKTVCNEVKQKQARWIVSEGVASCEEGRRQVPRRRPSDDRSEKPNRGGRRRALTKQVGASDRASDTTARAPDRVSSPSLNDMPECDQTAYV